mgnify:CR=1 FL=1
MSQEKLEVKLILLAVGIGILAIVIWAMYNKLKKWKAENTEMGCSYAHDYNAYLRLKYKYDSLLSADAYLELSYEKLKTEHQKLLDDYPQYVRQHAEAMRVQDELDEIREGTDPIIEEWNSRAL